MVGKNKKWEEGMEGNRFNLLDLFAGCGGLSKGFEQAGFQIVAANEFWEPAQETYKLNHPRTKFFPGDITDPNTKENIIKFFKDKRCDVLVGGPPCQAYSTAGLRNPDDPRGKLFEDYVDIVRGLSPKVFVMENVKGILTMEHDRENLTDKETKQLEYFKNLEKEKADLMLLRKQSKNNPERFKFGEIEKRRLQEVKSEVKRRKPEISHYREPVTDMIVRRFKGIGYPMRFKLLNAADYGVPQKRERVFFIGTRYNVPILFPEPTHTGNSSSKQEGQTTLTGGHLKSWKTIREVIDDLKDAPEDEKLSHIYTTHSEQFKRKIRNTSSGESVFGGYSDAFFRNPPDEPSRTVKENHGGVLVHYEKDRVMTPRELARLQTFPDDFIFLGSKSTILKQIGNAVPPGLGKAIGESVRQMLEEIEKNEDGK